MSEVVKITRAGHKLTAEGRARIAQNGRIAAAVSIANRRARAAARLEDLEFLATQGATRAEAAQRAGFPTVSALDRFLQRRGRADLKAALPTDGRLTSAREWWAA